MKTIVDKIERYYSEKIKKFGPIPQGVDWNGEASQNLRFEQLMRLLDPHDKNISLLDFGCGYGALFDYLTQHNLIANYTGFDISQDMIKTAIHIHQTSPASWTSKESELSHYDYVVASGVFNVMENTLREEWEKYIFKTLSNINSLSIKGFAFNLLTEYSDADKVKNNLFYASPSKLFDHCKTTFSKSVALLHDYPLYEFTVVVRKNIL